MQRKLLNTYFFFVFLLTAQPCNILNITDVGNPLTVVITLLFSTLMCIRCKTVNFAWKRLVCISVLMALWGFLQYVLLQQSPSPLIFVELFVAFTIFYIYQDDLFERFEKLSVKLATISIFLWIICLVAYEPMYSLAKAIGSPGATESQSIYIFSVPNYIGNRGFLLRNCGYSWEPGRFSCMLIIALWFNILRTNLNFKDRNFIILTLALISSQSTTGYLIYILMISLYFIFNKKWNPIYLIIGCFAVMFIMTLPFMREKIESLMFDEEKMELSMQNMEYTARQDAFNGFYVPQRFEGYMYQLVNFEHSNKIIGDGRNFSNFYINKALGFPIVVSEGIINIFIRYGIIIALLMYYSLFRSSLQIGLRFPGRGHFLFFVLFLGLSFSYYLWAAPIFMTLWLWSYWSGTMQTNTVKKTIKYN